MNNLLTGARILDLTQMLAGPYGSMLLADMGAEVIKIEEPLTGDRIRQLGPPFIENESAYFVSVNRNKKSLTIDLKNEKGKEILYELVKKADVVYDNFKPGTLERLGCDHEVLKTFNQQIISCSVSAYGQTGPYRDLPAFDLSLQAMGGAMSITGEPDRPPVRMGLPMGDLSGGMFAAFAISAALWHRDKYGVGQHIDVSLLDCQVSLLTYIAQYYFVNGEIPQPIGSAHQSVVPYQAFKTKDIYIVIAIFVEKYWQKLCNVMDLENIVDDPRFSSNAQRSKHRHELIPILEERFVVKNGEEWLTLFRQKEIPSAPVNTIDKVLNNPQVLFRNMVVEMEHASYGSFQSVGNPIKTAGMDEEFRPAPLLGEHTSEILSGLLGYSNDKLVRLKKEKVV